MTPWSQDEKEAAAPALQQQPEANKPLPRPELSSKSLQPLESQMWEDSIIWGKDSEDEAEEESRRSRRDEKRARKMTHSVVEEDEVR
jgi:hypothetical protein